MLLLFNFRCPKCSLLVYRDAILYVYLVFCDFADSISLRKFLFCSCLEIFFTETIILSATRVDLSLPFQPVCLLFVYFTSLHWLDLPVQL